MGDLSFGEILVVVLVIIILFGPKKIPEIARGLGQGVRKMRGAMDEIKQEIAMSAILTASGNYGHPTLVIDEVERLCDEVNERATNGK